MSSDKKIPFLLRLFKFFHMQSFCLDNFYHYHNDRNRIFHYFKEIDLRSNKKIPIFISIFIQQICNHGLALLK